MVIVENLAIRSGTFVLERISFEITPGQYVVLMGKTGTGKTTLLEAICGLKTVMTGRIQVLGRDVTRMKAADRGIGYVPQDRALFPTMTVYEQLAFSLVIRRWDTGTIDRRVQELAELLGVEHLLHRMPQGLSGGEAQRVALGRALASRPQVLLLDEPLSALDEETREEMYALLKSVRQHTGVTTIHVTHSLSEARRLADKLLLLRQEGVQEAAVETLDGQGRPEAGRPLESIHERPLEGASSLRKVAP